MMSPMTSAPRAVTPVPRRPRQPVPLQKRRASPMRNIVQTVPAKDNFSVRSRGPAVAPTATASESTLTVPLSEEALRRLRRTRSLFLCCRNLVSLSHVRHLEHMTGLVSLNVHMNAITRLGGIGHLRQLTELDVSANELRSVDADAFVGLVHLRRLNLSSNFLSSISGLEHLSALEWLSLSFNQLTDISALRRLQAPALLTHFDVCGNRIATCRALEAALAQCTELRELRVETPQGALVVPSAPPHLRLRENAFCAAEPNYAERLLRLFPRLERLNGVACGVDPTQSPSPLQLQSAEECGGTAPIGPFSKDSLKIDPFPIDSLPIDPLPIDTLPSGSLAEGLPALLCDESTSSDESRRHRWRAKRVSRGVVTDLSLPPRECFLRAGDSAAEASRHSALLIARLEASQLRAQEQMALHAVHEADLRRHVEDARRAAHTAAGDARRLAQQVAALKEELSRRAEEAALVARRNRAEIAALKNERRTQQQREAHSARVLLLLQEEQCARFAVEARAHEAAAGAAQCAAKEMRDVCRAQCAARQRERSQWDVQWAALRRELVAAQPKPKSDCGCDPIGTVCDAAEARRAAEALDEARACANALREALTAAVEKAKDAMQQAAVANERAVVEAKKAVENKAAADAAINETKAMAEARDAAIVEAKSIAEARDKAISEAKAIAEARDKAISEAKAIAEARDTAIAEAKAMAEARDKAISEAKSIAEARDIAISEAKAIAEAAADENVAHAVAEAQRERDNLLRTVHNLRDSLAAKDAALDDLEEEAKAKLDEKRATIARLEAQLRDSDSDSGGGGTAKDRRQTAELEQTAARQAALLQRAAEALARVRAQLARVDAVNERLERKAKEAVEAREAKDAELRRVQAQWREAQDSTRARQRATLQALAQMMADGTEAAT